jgi:CRISPR-associated protein Cas4
MSRAIIKNIKYRRQPFDSEGLSKAIEDAYLLGVHPDGHKQKKTFSPSKIGYGHGNCPRYWYLAFKGGEFKETTDALGVANMTNGSAAHDRIQKLFEDSGMLIEKEVKITLSDPPVLGFVDVLIRYNGEVIVGEIKTARQESFVIRQSSMKPSSNHMIQILLYMKATAKKYGFVMYENKNTQEFLIIPIEMTEKNDTLITNVMEWMKEVYAAFTNDTLPNRSLTKRSRICKECPLSDICDAAPSVTGTEIPMLEVTV